ncbi:MAG: response regulator [Ardenticatenaceae bacterium]|nr:response regulator [Ardenticatenaceae bacterium]
MTQEINVVYVEDEPNIAELLTDGLKLFGINVHPVYGSAEELLDHCATPALAHADMFFFDIRLPRMTGLELAARLRELGEKRPFIMVSAWPPPTKKTLQDIDALFLPKPFSFPDMVQTIQHLAQNR